MKLTKSVTHSINPVIKTNSLFPVLKLAAIRPLCCMLNTYRLAN